MHSITQGTREELTMSYLLDILLTEYGAQVEATGNNYWQKKLDDVCKYRFSIFYKQNLIKY
jgi:hypothetical protein